MEDEAGQKGEMGNNINDVSWTYWEGNMQCSCVLQLQKMLIATGGSETT